VAEEEASVTAAFPILTAAILNWNRATLLERTLRSFLATVTVDYELFILDNASSDDSRAVIAAVCRETPQAQAILLDANLGGEAWNVALERARGQYVQFAANDIEFLPGWDVEMLRRFEAFPSLGQLSLYSPFPQADQGEVWETKPATLVTRDGVSVYLTEANVGGTSMIRRALWASGLRWTNLETVGRFKFPADGRFSSEVRRLGYGVAWSDRYLAVNWGHRIEEMQRDAAYYVENYASKPWLGVEGWEQRLAKAGYRLAVVDGRPVIVPRVSG
jgi:glycosyltransferase involved in cell wall biosynthesis